MPRFMNALRTLIAFSALAAFIPAGAQVTTPVAGRPVTAGYLPHPSVAGLHHLVLPASTTVSGMDEPFTLYLPGTGSSNPRPLLVGFHSYAHTELEFENPSNQILPEVDARDWYFVAPRGIYKENFGAPLPQDQQQQVIDWVLAHYPIDRDRIYGIGFSMGGGGVASYAARHLDRTGAMFAAIVNHTGGMSLTYTHAVDPSSHFALHYWFGGPPSSSPQVEFNYLRSSTIELDPSTLTVNQSTDMARNLTHMGVRSFHSPDDTGSTAQYLKTSTNKFHEQLTARITAASATTGAGGGVSELLVGPDTPATGQHVWWTMDAVEALNFLAGFTLAIPSASGAPQTIIDRDGRWFDMTVTRDAAGPPFTTFAWAVTPSLNRFAYIGSENLTKIELHTLDMGLDPSIDLRILADAEDNTPDTIVINDVTVPPLGVTPLGTPWSYSGPPANQVTVTETTGAFNVIIIDMP